MSYVDSRIEAVVACMVQGQVSVASDGMALEGGDPIEFQTSPMETLEAYLDLATLAKSDGFGQDEEDGTNPTISSLAKVCAGIMIIPTDSETNAQSAAVVSTKAYTNTLGTARSQALNILPLERVSWFCSMLAGRDGNSTTPDVTNASGITLTTPAASYRTGVKQVIIPILKKHLLAAKDILVDMGY
jgi:hypothetical protein